MPSCSTTHILDPGSKHAGEIGKAFLSGLFGEVIFQRRLCRIIVNVTNSLGSQGTSIHWHVSLYLCLCQFASAKEMLSGYPTKSDHAHGWCQRHHPMPNYARG